MCFGRSCLAQDERVQSVLLAVSDRKIVGARITGDARDGDVRSSLAVEFYEMRNAPMRYTIVIENAGGNFSAYVPDLPGCVATGTTIRETEDAIRGAIEFHLEGLRSDNLPIPQASSPVDYVEVAA